MSDSNPGIRLCPEHLCEIFWREELLLRVGLDWYEEVRRRPPQSFVDYAGNKIIETLEISWIDINTDEERVRLRKYLTIDGRIGGSGYPDPKRIMLDDGTRYRLTRPSRNEACDKCGRGGHEWPTKPTAV